MEASRSGNVEIGRLLLEYGADPNFTNNVRARVIACSLHDDQCTGHNITKSAFKKSTNPVRMC